MYRRHAPPLEAPQCEPTPDTSPIWEDLPHGGIWSRPEHSDGPVVCRDHGSTPDQHGSIMP